MSTPSLKKMDIDQEVDSDWQDLGQQIPSDDDMKDADGSPSKGKGGRPSQQFYDLIDKLVDQINTEVLSIAEKTGQKSEMVHRKLYGSLRGSNAWTDFAKYLKANLPQELRRLPEGTDYDGKCSARHELY